MSVMGSACPAESTAQEYRGFTRKCQSCLNAHFLLMFQAFLETFSHPVWVSDGRDDVLTNESARRLMQEGFPLVEASTQVEPGEHRKLVHNNVEYSVGKQSIVHGSCYALCELLEYVNTESADKLRQSTQHLRKMLAAQV